MSRAELATLRREIINLRAHLESLQKEKTSKPDPYEQDLPEVKEIVELFRELERRADPRRGQAWDGVRSSSRMGPDEGSSTRRARSVLRVFRRRLEGLAGDIAGSLESL